MYINPINFFLIGLALWKVIRFKKLYTNKPIQFLLLSGIPLILVFTSFSLFRATLPHWSGPGYVPLMLVASIVLPGFDLSKADILSWLSVRKLLSGSVFFTMMLILPFIWLINYSPVNWGSKEPVEKTGSGDFTQDMFGWKQLSYQFDSLLLAKHLPVLDFVDIKWFPASHTHYYLAKKYNADMYLLHRLPNIHKYAWINSKQHGLVSGKSYYHLALSNYNRNSAKIMNRFFNKVTCIDTLQVYRGGVLMRYGYLYECKNYYGTFTSPLIKNRRIIEPQK